MYRPSKRTDVRCEFCGRTESPEWRRGPSGVNTLCNACGIKYSKKGIPAGLPLGTSLGAPTEEKDPSPPDDTEPCLPSTLKTTPQLLAHFPEDLMPLETLPLQDPSILPFGISS